jgi:hypothetical protein
VRALGFMRWLRRPTRRRTPLTCIPAFLRADTKYLYMCLEYVVGGEFFTHLRKAGRFDDNSAKFYAAQISMIFDYLHKQVRRPPRVRHTTGTRFL